MHEANVEKAPTPRTDFGESAWSSFVIASLVSAAFFALFDPRLQLADDPVPVWLVNWPTTYAAGLAIFWLLTALVLYGHARLSPR